MKWIKQHPYLAGILALVGFIFLFVILKSRSGGSSAPVAAAPAGPSDNVQIAGIQAAAAQADRTAAANAQTTQLSAQLNAKQIDAATQLQIAQLNAQTTVSQTTAAQNVSLADIQSKLDIANVNVAGQVQLAGIQAGVLGEQIQAGLAATENTNATAVAQAKIVSDTQLGLGQQQTDIAINNSNNQLAAQLGYFNTVNTASNNQAATQQAAIAAALAATQGQQQVQIAGIQGYTTLAGQAIGAQQQEYNAGLAFAQNTVGTFGGSQNRLSLLTAALGQPGVAIASQNANATINAPQPGNTAGGILQGIGSILGQIF